MTRIGSIGPKAVITRDELVIPEVRFAEGFNGKRQPNRLCFYGTKEDGYTACLFWGGHGVRVKKAEDGLWYASYSGNPSIHNGWVRWPDGSISLSCTCPRVCIEKGWKTRRDAALAAVIVRGREDRISHMAPQVEKHRIRELAFLSEDGWQYVEVGGSAPGATP
jgi:hypothetical protein